MAGSIRNADFPAQDTTRGSEGGASRAGPGATVALVGNPNTGKSTIFCALTGYHQRIGNYPGVTVEKRTGRLRANGGVRVEVIDLPGAYSLSAGAEDEAIVMKTLLGRSEGTAPPDLIVVVVDASNLARNLFFTTQVVEIGRPVVIALNMTDLAAKLGLYVDAEGLSRELGVPVVELVATKEIGIDRLKQTILDSLNGRAPAPPRCPVSLPPNVSAEVDGLVEALSGNGRSGDGRISRVEALQVLLDPGGYHEQVVCRQCGSWLSEELSSRRARLATRGAPLAELEAAFRYAWIQPAVQRVVTRRDRAESSWSERADRLLTHRVFGLAILVFLMAAVFQAIYSWAEPLMGAIETSVAAVGAGLGRFLPSGALQSLLVDGVVAGVGAVLVFLPQILILFLFIALLEDCGYMARAAFLLDRWMGLIGLNGKSFIPLVSSFACAVPAILATRTMENRRDRFVTILIAPLMSCSARLPVYVLLIGAFIPATPLLGGLLGLQAVTLFAMYCVGAMVAIPVALLMKRTVLRGPTQSFLMELPTYKWPSPRIVIYRVYEQGREFCATAGTIIFAVTIVIWALGYYPRSAELAGEFAARRAAALASYQQQLAEIAAAVEPGIDGASLMSHPHIRRLVVGIEQGEPAATDPGGASASPPSSDGLVPQPVEERSRLDHAARDDGGIRTVARRVADARQQLRAEQSRLAAEEAGAQLRHSFLGRMGRWIEPAVEPAGWDWRIGTAAIAAFPAREVFIATMGTIYNLGDDQDEESTGLREKLREASWPDGRAVYSIPVALSIMVFFALCCQCGGTLAAIKRETHSWRWPLLTFTYMTVLAYAAALLTYQVSSRLT